MPADFTDVAAVVDIGFTPEIADESLPDVPELQPS
jgi:hypothetical protein